MPDFPEHPWLDVLIRESLEEDVGSGDVTTAIAIDAGKTTLGRFTARQAGVVAGLPLISRLYELMSSEVVIRPLVADGDFVQPGTVVAEISGPAGVILTGERTALNFLQQLSGIATMTHRYVEAVAGTGCRILDTRKTLPGYRLLAKYAVRCGGGDNHRMGLYDRVLLKDNHWAARDDTLADLVARSRRDHPQLMIEIEVDSLDQLADILPLQVEWILLDNFTPAQVVVAVAMRDAAQPDEVTTRLEASGNLDLTGVRAYAEAGVDAASIGRLTHSVQALDLGLDFPDNESEEPA